jgi:hypothetical protein
MKKAPELFRGLRWRNDPGNVWYLILNSALIDVCQVVTQIQCAGAAVNSSFSAFFGLPTRATFRVDSELFSALDGLTELDMISIPFLAYDIHDHLLVKKTPRKGAGRKN